MKIKYEGSLANHYMCNMLFLLKSIHLVNIRNSSWIMESYEYFPSSVGPGFKGLPCAESINVLILSPTTVESVSHIHMKGEEGLLFYFSNLLSFYNFLFYVGVQLFNRVMIASGGRQRDTAVDRPVSVLPQTPSYPAAT